MKELPIIFSQEMVKAILEGRKTQTRRIIKPQPEYRENESIPDTYGTFFHGWNITHPLCNLSDYVKYAKYQVGDRLWVKEVWKPALIGVPAYNQQEGVIYKADDKDNVTLRLYLKINHDQWCRFYHNKLKWQSSRFMPKWAARIWLEVTGVRVERLKEISDNDIICEGFETREDFYGTIIKLNRAKNPEKFLGKWVWVYEFKRSK